MSVVEKTFQEYMVGHLEGNYRVGWVYVERHTIWERSEYWKQSVYTIGQSSSVPPLLVGQAQGVYSQKHFDVM